MVNLLKVAKVAIRPEMAEALALSAAHATPDEAAGATSQDLLLQLRDSSMNLVPQPKARSWWLKGWPRLAR